MTSVLYDAPGPRAKSRNILYTVLFVLVLALAAWWVVGTMTDRGQFEWEKWSPFFTDSRSWTTYILPALGNTLKAAGLSMVIALPLGAVLGIARMSDHVWVRGAAGTVVEFFRAIPVLILMLFSNELYARFTDVSPEVRPLYAVVTGLVLYNASVLAEVVRAGILSLPSGQTEAAKAIGLRKGQTMSQVLLPQAVTVMLPAIVSQLVVVVKDTALGGALLGFPELLNSVRQLNANYANTIPSFLVIAALFILLNFALTTFASWLEAKLRTRRKSAAPEADGPTPVQQTEPGPAGPDGPPVRKTRA